VETVPQVRARTHDNCHDATLPNDTQSHGLDCSAQVSKMATRGLYYKSFMLIIYVKFLNDSGGTVKLRSQLARSNCRLVICDHSFVIFNPKVGSKLKYRLRS
jgi:hypothetical protein